MTPTPSFPLLQTPRLRLRQTTPGDWKEVLYLRSDPEMLRHLKKVPMKNREEVMEFLDKINMGFGRGENVEWCISLRDGEAMIGSICLWNYSADRTKAEVGYLLSKEHQGRGIMSEALRCVLDYGFEVAGFNVIEAFTHHANASSRTLLTRHGFVLHADRRDEENPANLIYSLICPVSS